MTTYEIHDDRLNRVPAVILATSWDEMVQWAADNGLTVSKRRTEWDRDLARVTGMHRQVKSFACLYSANIGRDGHTPGTIYEIA